MPAASPFSRSRGLVPPVASGPLLHTGASSKHGMRLPAALISLTEPVVEELLALPNDDPLV
jgi:hypothetical protein